MVTLFRGGIYEEYRIPDIACATARSTPHLRPFLTLTRKQFTQTVPNEPIFYLKY